MPKQALEHLHKKAPGALDELKLKAQAMLAKSEELKNSAKRLLTGENGKKTLEA